MSTTSLTFRPLAAWPHKLTPRHLRKRWPSDVTLSRAMRSVVQQLDLLGCIGSAYIEADVEEKHIRQDGQLYASAKANSPGVIVSARHRTLGDLRWACDRFASLAENLRAIAMTISALRAVDRYGCVRDAEQFRGFKALPEKASTTMPRAAALAVLTRVTGIPLTDTASDDALAKVLRVARSRSHPDRNNGDREQWDHVETAAGVLGLTS